MNGKKLRQIREAKGLTQEELAEKAGVTKGIVSLLETGKRKFLQPSLDSILQALNVTPPEFFKSNVEPIRSCICHDWPDNIKKECESLCRILKSDDEVAITAITQNLAAFDKLIEKGDEVIDLKKDMANLKKEMAVLKEELSNAGAPSGTGAAGSGIGKPRRKT